MSIVRVRFVFDYENFIKRIEPAINDLIVRRSVIELKKMANEVVTNNPEIWNLMDDLAYFPSDLGYEEKEFDDEKSSTTFWITLIIVAYCLRIKNHAETKITSDILKQLGVDEN